MKPRKLKSTQMSTWRKTYSKMKRRALKHLWLARLGLVVVVAVALYLFVSLTSFVLNRSGVVGYVSPATNFLFAATADLKKDNGRTNVLIMGKGGGSHDAPELTDTIIFASISHEDKKAVLISLPRDIWLTSKNIKINHAFFYGKEIGGAPKGLTDAKLVVEEVVGQPIHYSAVINFDGFTRLIDALGGVEVEVIRSFTDYQYPIAGRENDTCGGDLTYSCRYETISFSAGKQTMSGETALKFARSRHAEGEEGTDFARAARQQKIIQAVKDKVLSTGVIFNTDKISELIKLGESSVERDMSLDEGAVLARLAFDSRDKLETYVVGGEFLFDPPVSPRRYGGNYVLLPKSGNWDDLHAWIETLLP